MMRFDYLHDAPPDIVERIAGFRVPAELRTPFAALLTACLVVLAWWSLERHWIAEAMREEAVATSRLEQSRAAFDATRLNRANVEQLLALDRSLRQIRLSGAMLSAQLADIGNHVPRQAWLTSIDRADGGFELQGRAAGLSVLSKTVADLMSSKIAFSLALVHAATEERSNGALIAFTLRVTGKKT